jgi:multisubunit Na+/H+ antiporter MnhG subunit
MTHPILDTLLLGLTVLIFAIYGFGLVRLRGSLAKLHMLGPPAMICPVLVSLAVIIEESTASSCIKAIIIALLVMLPAPVLTHIYGKAVRMRRVGDLRIKPEEEDEQA